MMKEESIAKPTSNWGFGIVVNDPTGATVKYWTSTNTAWNFTLGGSYFGAPRLGLDHLWEYNAFSSNIVKMHVGLGGALGFGDGHGFLNSDRHDKFYGDDRMKLGARGLIGIDIYPKTVPLEFFLDAGVMMGLVPSFGVASEMSFGIRFYP